jgi:hypothetical protein
MEMNKVSRSTKSSDGLGVLRDSLVCHPGVRHGSLGGRRCVGLGWMKMKVVKVKRGVQR